MSRLMPIECEGQGLNYLNNRYQDPTTGTFISVDPLVAKTGQPYLYAAGNPTTLSDPSGLDPFDWFMNMIFGSLVHAYIEVEYMKMYPDTMSDVQYRVQFAPGVENVGYIDLASFPGMGSEGADVISMNEIRPTRASAESELARREADINSLNPTIVPIKGLTGMLRTQRDERPFQTNVDVLGVSVHAWRDGAGVIVYGFDAGNVPVLAPRDIFKDLRRIGIDRRALRTANAANTEFAIAARTATEPFEPWKAVWHGLQNMYRYVTNIDLSPPSCGKMMCTT